MQRKSARMGSGDRPAPRPGDPGRGRRRRRHLPACFLMLLLSALAGCRALTESERRFHEGVYRVGVMSKSDTEIFNTFDLKLGEECAVPGTNMTLEAPQFAPSFSYSNSRREISSLSDDLNNPALFLKVREGDKQVYRDWLFIRSARFGNLNRLPVAFLLLKITLPEGGGRPAEEMRAEQWWGDDWRRTVRFDY